MGSFRSLLAFRPGESSVTVERVEALLPLLAASAWLASELSPDRASGAAADCQDFRRQLAPRRFRALQVGPSATAALASLVRIVT